jgi:hypothetical protein
VADDEDFALAAAIFEAEPRAFLPVELPRRLGALKHDGAVDVVAQFFDFRIGYVASLRLSAGAEPRASGSSSPLPCPADREAVTTQGRAKRAGARDTPLAARPSLAVATLSSSSLLIRRLTGGGANEKSQKGQ